uniref:Uncharacterized protein n=2 Tax=Aegilops tauschii subsp. strangulata TaxID=200361 RepID=A0A453PYW9_AEGTS
TAKIFLLLKTYTEGIGYNHHCTAYVQLPSNFPKSSTKLSTVHNIKNEPKHTYALLLTSDYFKNCARVYRSLTIANTSFFAAVAICTITKLLIPSVLTPIIRKMKTKLVLICQ